MLFLPLLPYASIFMLPLFMLSFSPLRRRHAAPAADDLRHAAMLMP